MRGAGWNRPLLGTCVAQVVKLKGASHCRLTDGLHPCGAPAREEIAGRVLCSKHARVAKEREAAKQERAS